LAGGGILVFVILLLVIGLQLSKAIKADSADGAKSLHQHFATGKKLMAQGKFHGAARELDEALALREKNPEALSSVDNKQLSQLQREARFYIDLLSESLEEIVFQAAAERDDQEWQAVFAERYRGKSLIFFALVRQDHSNRFTLDYQVFVKEKPARVDLDNLHVLRHMHLNQPERLLLGVRLASVDPDVGGTWTVRLEPDSGLLLTDADALANLCSPLTEEMQDALKRQAAWINELP
jgi:hypothetical protein